MVTLTPTLRNSFVSLNASIWYFLRAVLCVLGNPSEEAANAFRCYNFNAPYLIVGSEDDTVSSCSQMAGCATLWQEKGNPVSTQSVWLLRVVKKFSFYL